MNEPSPSRMQPPPRILLVGLMQGMGGMHMPRHLARAGLEVVFAGVNSCMASRSGHVRAFYPWQADERGLSAGPFIDCVRQSRPRWVVPLDELAAQALQKVGAEPGPGRASPLPGDVVDLVRRCLGHPAAYPLFQVRRRAFDIARAAGIPMPAQADVDTFEACAAFGRAQGYPVVLKQEESMGGVGAHILGSEAALLDFTSSGEFGLSGPPWVIQAFVAGALGMHAVLADRGRVLARLSAVQIQRRSDRLTAPSSVVRLMAHEGMAASGAAFVAATGASGFHGWDFQLDAAGRAVMIEHNPRPISISHLGGLLGDDLCVALATLCGVAADHAAPAPVDVDARDVALFPDEWLRDPHSPALQAAFHDAPWDDRPLFTALLQENVRFI